MNRESLVAKATVLKADTEDLFAMANSKGIRMPHPALIVWSCLLAEIEEPNENGVRLGEEATKKAVETAIGTQINWNHEKAGSICGHIIHAEIKNKKDIWITCVGFKNEYENEFSYAKQLFKRKRLAMSFELSADVESQEKLSDGTRRVNDYYFTGAGLLLGVLPACPKAYVSEMASKIEEERRELVTANKSTNSIIDSIIKIVNLTKGTDVNIDKIDANYQCECLNCGKVISSTKHCKDIKCSECGGEMRRKDRPGVGAEKEEGAKWPTAYINKLPNSSFAVIEPAYLKGDTDNKNARHLPFKNAEGKVDLPHYRNALARVNQIKPITDSISQEELQKKAKATLNKYKHLLKKEQANTENKGEIKVELEQLKKDLTAELGKEIVANWTDEDFQNEEKVAKARQAKIDAQSTEKQSEEKTSEKIEDASKTVEQESITKTKTTVDDDGKETVVEETLVIQKVDGKETYRRKSNEERLYAQAEIDAMQKTINELKASLETKDSEIEEVRANAEKIGQLKVQYKDNEFTAEFKDEDWLNEDKINEAIAKKEKAEIIVKNKEELKDNEFAKDFSDEDYANADKVELAKLKADNKALQEKIKKEEAEKKENEEVNASKEDEMDTKVEDKDTEDVYASLDPVAKLIMQDRQKKIQK